MPLNTISIGKDITIKLNNNQGLIETCRLKQFMAKQKTSDKESLSIDGINRHGVFFIGWEGDFEMDRTSSIIDDYFANLEANYYAGNDIPTITITETITEMGGAISQYLYEGVVLKFTDAGTWKADEFITQKVAFSAEKKVKLQ